MHLMRSKKLINTWVAEQVWPLPSLSPIPSQNSQLLNEMGPKLGNGTSPCFFTFLRGGVWQVIPKYFYFSEKTFCFLYMQYPSKNDAKPLTLLCCSRSYKCSSGRSISKAALHSGNLCVYEPSTLRKKPPIHAQPSNAYVGALANFALQKI